MYCISRGLSSGFNLGTSLSSDTWRELVAAKVQGALMVCRDTSLSLASTKNWAPAFREAIRPHELESRHEVLPSRNSLQLP